MKTEGWKNPVLGPCLCSRLRRTARAVSAFYDSFLEPGGLTVTQYAILVNIAREKSGIQRTALASRMGMERTTLTRNLSPLEREGWITGKAGSDKRARMIAATPKGLRKLGSSYPLWAAAQADFLERFGAASAAEWTSLMDRAVGAVRNR
ncbi:MAG: MarR family winged helix-turn-helix transcriptional regulator [Bryobacteraceae bacterium]